MGEIGLRPARAGDLEAIAEIYNHEVLYGTATFDTEPRTSAEVGAWLLERGSRYPSCVALSGERIVGFAGLLPWSPRKAYDITAENTVYTHPDARGLGAGRLLLEAVLEQGRAAGLHSVIARIAAGNEASLRLHRRLGFETVGTLREAGRKFGRLIDVQLMQLMLRRPSQAD